MSGVADDTLDYIDLPARVIKRRTDYTLNHLPLPCLVTIEGVEYEVTKQPTFEFDVPGTYTIQVDAGPRYLKKEFTLDYQP